jgi:hypothetical protein
MEKYQVVKRTFEAKKFPKGSEERKRLNENTVTSEYMTSYKYAVMEGEKSIFSYPSKYEAETKCSQLNRYCHEIH